MNFLKNKSINIFEEPQFLVILRSALLCCINSANPFTSKLVSYKTPQVFAQSSTESLFF